MKGPKKGGSERPLPRLSLWLLRRFLDDTAFEVISGDLEEEFLREILPRHGRRAARRWFRYQALAALVSYWRLPKAPSRTRSPRGDSLMSTFLSELRLAVRRLVKSPVFTLTAVFTLAFGLGANTAIFSVLETLLLSPLPYADAEKVSFLVGWDLEEDSMTFQVPLVDYVDLRRDSRSFEDLAAYRGWSVNLAGGGPAERLQGYRTTPNTFGLLGVRPHLGRAFGPRDAVPGEDRKVILSHGFWQRRYGGDPEVVGSTLLLNDEAHTVLGVMPRGFEFPVFNYKGDLWAPLPVDAEALLQDRDDSPEAVVVGRLAAGVEREEAQAEVAALAARLATDFPELNAHRGVRVLPMHEMVTQRLRPALVVAFVGVGVLLLMICANLAGLLLVRALGRRREIAVRATLGAGKGRLVGQLLIESLLLGLAGGAGGLALAAWSLAALRGVVPEFFLRAVPAVAGLGLDGRAAVFCLLSTLVAVGLFGIVPAVRATRGDLRSFLADGARNGGPGRQRLRAALVVGQVTISLALLLVTGLLLRTTENLLAVEPGFEPRGVLAASVSLRPEAYETDASAVAFFREVEERAEALPGVESAGWVNTLPFSTSGSSRSFRLDGQPEVPPAERPRADFRTVSPGYLPTLKVPLLGGRRLESSDRPETLPVALVNQAFVRRHFPEGEFPEEQALGRRVLLQGDEDWRTVVGVVGDVLHWQLTDAAAPEVYVPLAQRPRATMTLAVRSRHGDPGSLAPLLRSEVAAVDPAQPLYDLTSLEELLANSVLQHTLSLAVMATFGVAALLLAVLGLYGMISYSVQQSRQEIGIRMALGACFRDVLGLVLRQGVWLIGLGTVLGLAAAYGASHLVSALLYGVEPTDPLTYVLGTALLVIAALAACGIPAYRATQVDPNSAIRLE